MVNPMKSDKRAMFFQLRKFAHITTSVGTTKSVYGHKDPNYQTLVNNI